MQVFRFRLIDTSDPTHINFYEDLMTKVHNDDETLEIIKQETTFNKDGGYFIALHWLEDTADEDRKDSLRKMLKEKI